MQTSRQPANDEHLKDRSMTMTSQRFAQIVDAYGADPRRWPPDERAAAQAFAQARPEEAQARLHAAAALDACLAADVVEPAGRALQRRIVASAKAPRKPRPLIARPVSWWLPGAALAGAGAAGIVAGALAMSMLVSSGHPSVTHEPSYLSTGFDAPGGEGSVE
jgi:hypothetical protein